MVIYQVSDDTGGCSSDAAVAEPFASCQTFDYTCRIVNATIPTAIASYVKHEVIESPEQKLSMFTTQTYEHAHTGSVCGKSLR